MAENNSEKYVPSFREFINHVINKMGAPVKSDKQMLQSSSLCHNLIYLYQTVSETVDSVSICAETAGKRILNNCLVAMETFV